MCQAGPEEETELQTMSPTKHTKQEETQGKKTEKAYDYVPVFSVAL